MTAPGEEKNTAVKLAVLESEMAQVSADVKEIKDTLKSLVTLVQKMEVDAAGRTATMERIESEQSYIQETLRRSKMQPIRTQKTRDTDDESTVWKNRAVNGLITAACLAAILALLVFIEHNLLSPQAMKAAHDVGDVVK